MKEHDTTAGTPLPGDPITDFGEHQAGDSMDTNGETATAVPPDGRGPVPALQTPTGPADDEGIRDILFREEELERILSSGVPEELHADIAGMQRTWPSFQLHVMEPNQGGECSAPIDEWAATWTGALEAYEGGNVYGVAVTRWGKDGREVCVVPTQLQHDTPWVDDLGRIETIETMQPADGTAATMAHHTIPWLSLWLYFYEVWLETDTWYGFPVYGHQGQDTISAGAVNFIIQQMFDGAMPVDKFVELLKHLEHSGVKGIKLDEGQSGVHVAMSTKLGESETIPPMGGTGAEQTETQTVVCPSCGEAVHVDSACPEIVCPECLMEFDLDIALERERDEDDDAD